jgi:hypothetical protein
MEDPVYQTRQYIRIALMHAARELPDDQDTGLVQSEQPALNQLQLKYLETGHRYYTTIPNALEQPNFTIKIPQECMISKTLEHKLRRAPIPQREALLADLMDQYNLSHVIVLGPQADIC